jgi:hypothetical protein
VVVLAVGWVLMRRKSGRGWCEAHACASNAREHDLHQQSHCQQLDKKMPFPHKTTFSPLHPFTEAAFAMDQDQIVSKQQPTSTPIAARKRM